MHWFYAPEYNYARNLPQHRQAHGFVLDKPSQIRARLLETGAAREADFVRPEPVAEAELAAVHTPEVIQDLHDAFAVSRAVEFDAISLLPDDVVWQAVVASQLHAAGGTAAALRRAAGGDGETGEMVWAANLSGGFHHARPDRSHGFCLVNDVALAVARLHREGLNPKLLILDLDVHQGDGNASCFAKHDDVFTFSMHEHDIFPHPKAVSDLDVGLPPKLDDAGYLEQLEQALAELRERTRPEIVVYVAGTDVYEHDRLGSLRLTAESVVQRDRRVAEFTRELGCALVVLPAGGYSPESPRLTADGFAAIAEVERSARG